MNSESTDLENNLKNQVRRMQRRVQQMEAKRRRSFQQDESELEEGPILLRHPYASSGGAGSHGNSHYNLPSTCLLFNRAAFAMFLDPEMFLQSCSNISPTVSPELRWMCYLCGGLILGDDEKVATLVFAAKGNESHIVGSMSQEKSTRRGLECLQTSVLWVKLHLYSNRLLEANYSSTRACATAASLQLGSLGSQNTNSSIDKILSREDGEKIHSLWAMYDSEYVLAMARNGVINLSEDAGKPSLHIDTPLPRPFDEYDSVRIHRIPPENTIKKFRKSTHPIAANESLPSLQAKAIAFFYLAYLHYSGAKQNPSPYPDEMSTFHRRDAQILSFIQTMPPLGRGANLYHSIRYQTNIHAARITLHFLYVKTYEPSKQPSLDSAIEIFRLAALLPIEFKFIDASFALAWERASFVLTCINEAEWGRHGADIVRKGLLSIAKYRTTNSFMDERIGRVVSAFAKSMVLGLN
ncbi:hypothetical protein DL96DRAFT_1742052 [Flagelloscypha sp. PMI_526]|nr:hypothetical protein DL96DRAFT_1742052 [Flagelloscypha sp. PMI_526]